LLRGLELVRLQRAPFGERRGERFALALEALLQLFKTGVTRLFQVLVRACERRLQHRAADLELRHALELAGQPEPLTAGDQPFGWIELPPAHAVAVVPLKQMMEVVIALAIGEQREHVVVARGVVRGVRTTAPEMRERVDEEG